MYDPAKENSRPRIHLIGARRAAHIICSCADCHRAKNGSDGRIRNHHLHCQTSIPPRRASRCIISARRIQWFRRTF